MDTQRPSRREDFEIAIICALRLEYDALSYIFDQFWDEYGDLYKRTAGDPNNYTTGRIGKYNVVLALLPHTGKANAASAAASIRLSYSSLRLVLLVGICGGVPRTGNGSDDEILLGDVIISKTIVQYDFGRQYPDKFMRKDIVGDNLSKPNKDVRNLLITFETDRGGDQLRRRTAHFLKQLQANAGRRWAKYSYPGTVEDKLFNSSYRHKHHVSPMCLCRDCRGLSDPVCDKALNSSCYDLGCDDRYLVSRERLKTKRQLEHDNMDEAQQPAVHIGPVASGDKVMKSGEDRDRIAKSEGIIAFEMEGAGVWEEVPCIVIKGVCDYADSHKCKTWQNFAAATAAAASKAILERYVETDKVPGTHVVDDVGTGALVQSVPSSRREMIDRIAEEDLHKACLASLNRPVARSRIENVEDTFGETCSWLFQQKVGFEDWLTGKIESPVYWIQGSPGSGKSTAMKFALKHEMTQNLLTRHHSSDWVLAGYFFHDRGSSIIQKSMDGLLHELLFQILLNQINLIRPVVMAYPADIKFSSTKGVFTTTMTWTSEDVKQALEFIASQGALNLCLFIDALDEHSGNHHELLTIVDILTKLAKNSTFRLRLCLASRPENIFQQAFRCFPGFAIQNYTSPDIRQYTTGKMARIAADSPGQFELLLEQIVEKANGIFIWVKLVINELMEGWDEGDRIEELEATLAKIPLELQELYERAVRRCPRTDTQTRAKYRCEAYIMFQIALCSRKPYEIDLFMEIADFITSGVTTLKHMEIMQMERRLRGRCAGLLEVVHDEGVVQFIHQTAKEFFLCGKGCVALYEKAGDMPIENGHTYLLQYMVSAIVDGQASKRRMIKDIFFHAHKAELTSHTPSLNHIDTILNGRHAYLAGKGAKEILQVMSVRDSIRDAVVRARSAELGSLVIAVCACLPQSVKERLTSQAQLVRRHAEVLLTAGVCRTDCFNIDNLEASAGILQLLLQTGIKADCIFDGETPFSMLITCGSNVFDEPEEPVSDEDSNDKLSQNELWVKSHWAAHGIVSNYIERARFLSILLKYGADPNQMIRNFLCQGASAPPMVVILTEEHPEILLEVLLSFDADVSLEDSDGFTPLFYAIAWDEQESVKMLLTKADPRHLNSKGLSALSPRPQDFAENAFQLSFDRFESLCCDMSQFFAITIRERQLYPGLLA